MKNKAAYPEYSDGYHWFTAHFGLGGHATTAGCALYQLKLALEKHKHMSTASAEAEQEPNHDR